ncbi:Tetraacyldisaccharide 4'-kinase [Cystobacter fuscus DSM 2262]|uniref:Tetraacyldisaccharide 4'-kinase n=1 Tax=Cystobacter fuscus (strain ATCC 25194 / DSM 2262 / NBRC 100088 / M29) TaxID=1242864 RepID=S9Q8T0_CYSF2|nr:tetraacyldisaccharide 4'-kinase [Cystobacter fuscus]EPX57754.1 Tetraacyldisaccharide 4'-kinase [Cystobacter fuscus DSM 2262]
MLAPLELVSWGYGAGVRLRGALYDAGWLRGERVEGLRVISVGNLNVGGTGKTPAVLYLAELLVREGKRVGILTRGYGRGSKEPLSFTGRERLPSVEEAGDEPLLLARRCPEARLLVGADRRALARRARDEYGLEVVLLDDGFQHRRLARDEDVVVVDEAVGFGNGRMLPRGPLREPLASLKRATLVWVRASSVPVVDWPPFTAPRVRTLYRPTGWVDPEGALHPPGVMEGRPVLALAGLARPGGFVRTLEELGVEVKGTAFFADHHPFSARELEEVRARAERLGARVVTTEKDRVRLPVDFETWTVRLGVEVLEGEAHLRRALGLE